MDGACGVCEQVSQTVGCAASVPTKSLCSCVASAWAILFLIW